MDGGRNVAITVVASSAIWVIILAALQYGASQRLSNQAAQIHSLQSQLANAKDAASDAMNNLAKQDDQSVRDAAAGIYELNMPGTGRLPRQIDLRSDGTEIACELYGNGQQVNTRKTTWTFSAATGTIDGDGMEFTPEGVDLIDSKGNRWERIR